MVPKGVRNKRGFQLLYAKTFEDTMGDLFAVEGSALAVLSDIDMFPGMVKESKCVMRSRDADIQKLDMEPLLISFRWLFWPLRSIEMSLDGSENRPK